MIREYHIQGQKDCKSQMTRMPAARQCLDMTEKLQPMKSQLYSHPNKTWNITSLFEMPVWMRAISQGPMPNEELHTGSQWLPREEGSVFSRVDPQQIVQSHVVSSKYMFILVIIDGFIRVGVSVYVCKQQQLKKVMNLKRNWGQDMGRVGAEIRRGGNSVTTVCKYEILRKYF